MSDAFLSTLQAALGDEYVVERELTAGGQSRLFLASDAELPRKVVIKLLPPELAGEVALKRFKREIAVLVKLQHPHIVPIIGMGATDDIIWYVMPYIPGESLEERLRPGPLPLREGLHVLHEVADALAHAHEIGVVHRDLKPANVLFQSGHAVLADFGVAHARLEMMRESSGVPLGTVRKSLAASGGRLTDKGFAVGTPGYMAPEQFHGDDPADARADVYSLAMLGYEILTGRAPFAEYRGARLMVAHFTEMPRPAHEVNAEVPEPVARLFERGMAKDPDQRFADAGEFREALGAHW
ncbi:MAG: serine/threonine protein kinase [Gemmatimonadaceae bacterium]|nr:serine/threonine protein kinase [Gemmatimonadaceae bacterium]MCW5826725.1 serine/threonine protein kinase [Gemmatimonadaceae bacterium]